MNPSTAMDIEEIRRYLPHRYPFLLIDRITEVEIGSRQRTLLPGTLPRQSGDARRASH